MVLEVTGGTAWLAKALIAEFTLHWLNCTVT